MFKKCLLLCLALVLLICACTPGGSNDTSSTLPDESSSEAVSSDDNTTGEVSDDYSENTSEEQSVEQSEEQSEENSEDTSGPETGMKIEIMYCSYDQYPYAVIVGKCAENAVIKATVPDGQQIESKSFYGWFSVRFKYSKGKEVTLTQYVDGVQVGNSTVYNSTPKQPGTSEGIVAGNDFQFFYAKCLNDYMRLNIPSKWELDSLTDRVKSRISEIKSSGLDTKLIYIIVPSAITVYPEAVPGEYKPGSGKTTRQMVMEALDKAGATVIDLEGVFNQHKNDTQTIFYKTDSHWTEYAAFLAYTELFNIIKADFPAAAPYEYDHFKWYSGYHKTGDMLNYLNMTNPVYLKPGFYPEDCLEYSWFRDLSTDVTGIVRKRFPETGVYSEEVTQRHLIETNRSNLPNCIVVRDSFGTQITDLIAGNMNTTLFQKMWDYSYNLSNIKRYNADYVIYIVSEWNAKYLMYS